MFKGIPITGSMTEFCKNLSQKGFTKFSSSAICSICFYRKNAQTDKRECLIHLTIINRRIGGKTIILSYF